MTRPRVGRKTPIRLRNRFAGALTLLSVGALLSPLVSSQPAAAQRMPDELVTATISTMEPASPRPGDTLLLSGTLHNSAAEPLQDLTVFPRYSRDPLEERSDIRRVVDDPDYRSGRRDNRFRWEAPDTVPPGGTVEWRLELPLDELNLGDAGVYVVGIDVRATLPDGWRLTVGETRSLVPWLGTDPMPSVPVAMIWPLSAKYPTLESSGLFIDDSLAAEIASDGALRELVSAGSGAPVTWLVDPDLLVSVERMTHRYSVRGQPGKATGPGTGTKDAAGWLQNYRAATAGATVYGLPFANPDVSALTRAGEGPAVDQVRAAASIGRQELVRLTPEASTVDILARPAGDAISGAGVDALSQAGLGATLVTGTSVRPATDHPTVRLAAKAGQSEIRAVRADPGLSAALADATRASDPATGALALRQRMLAETALAAVTAESLGDPALPLVAAPPQGWRPDAQVVRAAINTLTTTSWITPITLHDLPTASETVTSAYPADVAAAELSATYLESTRTVAESARLYRSMLIDAGPVEDSLQRGGLRLVSGNWRAHPDIANRFLADTAAHLDDRLSKVQLRVPNSVTLSSSSGRFPITVENRLPDPVQVRLLLKPANRSRLSTQPVPPVEVGAGEKATVDVYAHATSNGRSPVDVILAAPDGTPLGEPKQLVVVATEYGTIGWIVIIAGGTLLFGTALFRLVRGRGRPARAPVSSEIVEEEQVR